MRFQPRLRAALLQGTMLLPPALVFAALAAPALAQSIAPNARPQGGAVVGGTASIAQSATTTTITQGSNRAVIDWRSFNVGRDQLVEFQQPSASAMALNRVTGPNPSVIAGRITANGGVALVNQSGVVFAGGSQVNAHSVIVSTADIANAAFMAGGALTFDRPGKPTATIENNGTITVKQAGLAALVAPQVVNNGVIQARLATVVLAGAERHVIDINGDGLVSFEITDGVHTRPPGDATLVTNTGSISAPGGTVLLTAAAADGIIQNLVRAGGTISAPTDAATGRQGQVLFTGTGGSIRVEGVVEATGGAGMRGGTIRAVADRVLVTSTARLDASGATGGGTIGVGIATIGGKTVLADRTGIDTGAVLRADATVNGKGGRIDVNAKDAMVQAGSILARGGPAGGDGGTVEISSGGAFQLTGVVDVGAAAGLPGIVLVDPQFLTVVADGDARINVAAGDLATLILGAGDPPTNAFLGAGTINAITGNLLLQASSTLTVGAAINKPVGDLFLDSFGTLTINADVVLGSGNLTLSAQVLALNALAQVASTQTVFLSNGNEVSGGSVTETGAGRIVGGSLSQSGASFDDITLGGLNVVNQINGLRAVNALTFTNNAPLLLNGSVSGATVAVNVLAGDLTINGFVSASSAPTALRLRAQGNIALTGGAVTGGEGAVSGTGVEMSAGFDFTTGVPNPAAAGGITLAGSVTGLDSNGGVGVIELNAGTGGIVQTSGTVRASELRVHSGGGATLDSANTSFFSSNAINVLGPSDVAGDFNLSAFRLANGGTPGVSGDLQIGGDVRVGGTFSLRAMDSGIAELAGARILAGTLNASAPGDITFRGDNAVATLGTVSADNLTFRNVADLTIAGPVTTFLDLAVTVPGGNLTVTGTVNANNGELLLTASNNLVVSAGAAILTGGEGGPTTLQAATPDTGFDPTLPGAMTLAGTVNTIRLELDAGTGGIVQIGGQIVTNDLAVESGGSALLNGASPATPNSVGSLRGVTAAGDFALDNGSTALIVQGAVAAANIDLSTSADLILSGRGSPATLDAGTGRVSLSIGGISFLNPGNRVTAGVVEVAPRAAAQLRAGDPAGSTTPGALSFNQDVRARVVANTLRLGSTNTTGTTASGIRFTGAIDFAGTLDLASNGNVNQDAGASLTLGALTGVALGAIQLTDGGNAITTIGNLTAIGGNIDLTVAGPMSLAGRLSALGNAVNLTAGTGITDTGGLGIVAATLSAQTTSGGISLTGANTVDTLGIVSTPGNFTFNDNVALLTISAATSVSAGGDISIDNAGGIAITTLLAAAGNTITLAAATGIDESGGGSVVANTLTATTRAGDILLTGFNQVGTLGAISTPGIFSFNDSAALLTVLAGSTVGAAGGMTINTNGNLAVDGGLSSPGQTIRLLGGGEGAVISGNGVIAAGTLSVQATGDITLTGLNVVDALGNINTNGRFIFNDIAAVLTIPASTFVTAGVGIFIIETGAIAVAGGVDSNVVNLTAGTGISGGGTIFAGTLSALSSTGDISLTGANEVSALGNVVIGGAFTFNNVIDPLTVPVGSVVSATGNITITQSGALLLDGAVAAPGHIVALSSGTGISGAGTVTAGTLNAQATAGDIILNGPNAVDALGAVTTPGAFTFNDTAALLTVAAGGVVSSGAGMNISTTGAFGLAGQLLAPGQTVQLNAGGEISGTGAITAATLNAQSATGGIVLAGANSVDALGNISTPGAFTFNDTVTELAISPASVISAGGDISLGNTGSISISSPLDATGHVITLRAGTGIAEFRGSLLAATLIAQTTTGNIALGGPNVVDALGAVTTPGSFTFNDAAPILTVLAGSTVSGGSGIVINESGALAIAGRMSAPGQTVALTAGSGISGGGAITAALLNAQTKTGDIVLSGSNKVDALEALAAPGAITFNDTAAVLTISPGTVVSAGGDIAIGDTGSLAVTGQLSTPGHLITLTAGTGISATGALIAETLSVQTGAGDIALTGANVVAALGAVATPGRFTFNDTTALLTIAAGATVAAGTGMEITGAGAISLAGRLEAPGQSIALDAGTGISGGGAIVAGTLTVQTASGDVALGGPNRVDRLGASSAPGNITFHNDSALAVPAGNEVQAGGAAEISGGADVVVDGTVSGATLTLQAAGLVAVNGFSAIARTGALHLVGDTVTVTGLIAAGTDIVIGASTANLGGRATGNALTVNASGITFNGIDATGMSVFLGLGSTGAASGKLDVARLSVAGGSGVTLLGSIAGIGGGAAAALGVRADADGAVLGSPPPRQDAFTLNGCAIAVAQCNPTFIAPTFIAPTVIIASNPLVLVDDMDPRLYTEELTDTWLQLPRPRTVSLSAQPFRDASEDLDLAPPNVRSEDY